MAVDLTKLFRENVKIIRQASGDRTTTTANEDLFGKSSNSSSNSNSNNTKQHQTPSISREAKQIVTNITTLKNFLNDNKNTYIQPE